MRKSFIIVLAIVFFPILAEAGIINKCINDIKQNNVASAVAYGKLAVVLHPNNASSYACLGAAYIKDNKFNFAKVELEQAKLLATSGQKPEIDKLLKAIKNERKFKPASGTSKIHQSS